MTPTGAGNKPSSQANQEDRRARISLLCGKTGSGKSTYARQLEAAGALRFSTDEWLLAQAPAEIDLVYFDIPDAVRGASACQECRPTRGHVRDHG